MNNKELTELRKEFESNLGKLTLLKDEMESYYTVVNPSSLWRWIESKLTQPREEIKREAVEEFLKSQIEYEAEEYAVCPLCKREFIWGETYCPDDRRKLITETRNKLEWSNRNAVIKELIEGLAQKENNE